MHGRHRRGAIRDLASCTSSAAGSAGVLWDWPADDGCAPKTYAARERLDAVAATTDGFELARRDLELRREGDVLGARQTASVGAVPADGEPARRPIIEDAREDATAVVDLDPTLADHPDLAARVAARLDEEQAAYLERGSPYPTDPMTRIISGAAVAGCQTPSGRGPGPHRIVARRCSLGSSTSTSSPGPGCSTCIPVRRFGPRGGQPGARSAVLVDADRGAAKAAGATLPRGATGCGRARGHGGAGPRGRGGGGWPVDLVFLDPPYDLSEEALGDALALLVLHGWLARSPGRGRAVRAGPEPRWSAGRRRGGATARPGCVRRRPGARRRGLTRPHLSPKPPLLPPGPDRCGGSQWCGAGRRAAPMCRETPRDANRYQRHLSGSPRGTLWLITLYSGELPLTYGVGTRLPEPARIGERGVGPIRLSGLRVWLVVGREQRGVGRGVGRGAGAGRRARTGTSHW